MLLELFILLPFISGPAAMHIIAKKRGWSITFCDKLISGALVSNFALIAPSVLIGFFFDYLDELFVLSSLVSVFIILVWLFVILQERKRVHLSLNMKLTRFAVKAYMLPILLFALFALIFHTFYVEYDAIYVFLPYAKSIALTGGMKYNVYDQSALSTGMPPVLPLMYAWALTSINHLEGIGIRNDLLLHDMLRPVPAAYFLLSVLAVYLVAREALSKEHALLSVTIFASFPSTILTLSAFAYYLDLGFVFYITSTLLCLIKALQSRKPMWFFFTGIGSSLLLLSKELSIFIVPLIFSAIILFSSIKYRRAIFATLSTLPFCILFFWDACCSPTGWIFVRQLPVLALGAILYYLSNITKENSNSIGWRNFVYFITPFFPSVAFLLRGIAFLGSVYSIWGPAFTHSAELFHRAIGATQETTDVSSFFRWDVPFLSIGLGALYIIPVLFSIVHLFTKERRKGKLISRLILMVFFILLETMSFTAVGSQEESRRAYYFAPTVAILAANGLMLCDRFLKSKFFIYICIVFNSLALGYVWLHRFPIQTLLGLSYLKTVLGLASALDLAFFALSLLSLFVLLVIVDMKLNKEQLDVGIAGTCKRGPTHTFNPRRGWIGGSENPPSKVGTQGKVATSLIEEKKPRFEYSGWSRSGSYIRKTSVYTTLLVLSCILIVYPTIPLWVQAADKGFLSLQHEVYEPTWEEGILIVSHYYNRHIDDDFSTVSFGGHGLRYLANRSVIDLTTIIGVHSMQNILTIGASEDLLNALNESNIRYFLIPQSKNSFYQVYNGFRENFDLFRIIEQDSHFSLIWESSYYRLVKFESTM